MKILSLLLSSLLLITCGTELYAWERKDTDPEVGTISEFLKRSRLYVELEGADVHSILRMGSNGKKWKAYEGFKPISEEGFFRIAGYGAEADRAKKYQYKNYSIIIIGSCLCLGGLGMVYAGYSATEHTYSKYLGSYELSAPNYQLILTGAVITGIADYILYHGIVRSRKNLAPYFLAYEIANEYNASLERRQGK